MYYLEDSFVLIHEQSLQVSDAKMNKTSNGLSTPLMKNVFPSKQKSL